MNRNLWAAGAATVVVIAVVILGFHALGGPRTQRLVQSDLRTVRTLAELAQQINSKWAASNRTLPANLERFPKSLTQDPVNHEEISYRPKSNDQYELCATFGSDSRGLQTPDVNGASNFWSHPKGEYCFQFDATQQVPQAPYYY